METGQPILQHGSRTGTGARIRYGKSLFVFHQRLPRPRVPNNIISNEPNGTIPVHVYISYAGLHKQFIKFNDSLKNLMDQSLSAKSCLRDY